ncbi:protein-glutamate O-methyltransferase CheR [Sphingomonas cannabina]|uniref:CheR family methyltransferase n=1 Tax=Sphingomonas cannabina TaxID=2899123 RepID=UPI001F2BBE45|nr:protein-glutamate O-methyltransferase CheR [Sphingomonas cannabina]UIJ43582.1 protein-glutamate O-methyltransferase CheR [Sphingomonas cannabina]
MQQTIVRGPMLGGAMDTIAALLEQRTGQQIAASRSWRLEAALKPILRELRMTSLDDLVNGLVASRDGALSDRVVDALLNQETSFFRDAPVLEMAGDALVAMKREARGRRLRIWSAGCSTGQEPLSVAMLLHERRLIEDGIAPEIVATDVSSGAIGRARAARYSQFEVQRGLSIHRMIAWFEGEGAEWTAKRELVGRVQFRQHNLVSDPPPPGAFDLVLCRNIMLYFAPDVRARVFERLAKAMRPGSLLVLGASETVIGQTDKFVPSERWRGFYKLA